MIDNGKHQNSRRAINRTSEAFSDEDVAGGWTQNAREAAILITQDAILKINKNEKCDAAYHFVRWLDHMGVSDGPLLDKVAIAQQAIPHA